MNSSGTCAKTGAFSYEKAAGILGGAIYHLIPHMIEAGVDILNPIQTSAANMEPDKTAERQAKLQTGLAKFLE